MPRCPSWLRPLAIACCLALLPRCAHEERRATGLAPSAPLRVARPTPADDTRASSSGSNRRSSSHTRSHTGSHGSSIGAVAGELALGLLGALVSSLLESSGSASGDDEESGPDVAPLTATFDAREDAETFLNVLPVPCILDEERLEHIRASAGQSGVTLAITPGGPAGSEPCTVLPAADGHYFVLFGLEQP